MKRQPAPDAPRRLHLPEAVALLLLVAVPAYFNPHSTVSFEPDKMQWLRAAGIAAAGWLAVRRPAVPRRFLWLCLAWASVQAVATAMSLDPWRSGWGSDERAGGLLTALSLMALAAALAARLSLPDVRAILWRAVAWGSAPVVVFALAQAAGWNPVAAIAAPQLAGRVAASLGNPVFLGGALAMVIPVTVWLAWRSAGRARGAFALLALAQLAALALTQARGAWLGLAAGIGLAALLVAARLRRRRLAAAVAALAVAGAGLLLALNGPLADAARGVPLLGRLAGWGATGGTGGQRLLIWQGTVDALAGSPVHLLVGRGPEAMPLAYYPHYPPTLAEYEPDAAVRLPDRAHNLWWDAAMAGGALNVIATAALWGAALAGGLRRLGLWSSRREGMMLAGVSLAGAVIGAGLAAAARPDVARELLPLGASLGALAGLGAWLIGRAWHAPEPASPTPRLDGASVAALAALGAHFVDLQFGFATATTSLLFWLMLAMLLTPSRAADGVAAPIDGAALAPVTVAALLAASFGPVVGGGVAGLALAAVMGLACLALLYATAGWPPPVLWGLVGLPALVAALALALVANRLSAGPLAAWFVLLAVATGLVVWMVRTRRPGVAAWSGGIVVGILISVGVARPMLADIAHKHGLLLAAQGRVAEGYRWAARAVAWQPRRDAYRHSWAALQGALAEGAGSASEADTLAQQAEQALRDGWQRHPHAVAYAGWLADLAARRGDLAAAVAWYRAGLDAFPNQVEWRVEMASLQRQQGEGAAALAFLAETAALAPGYYPTYIAWGEALAAQGDAVAALARFRQAVAVAPWAGAARLALANALQHAGQTADALTEAQAAASLLSGDAQAAAQRLVAELEGR